MTQKEELIAKKAKGVSVGRCVTHGKGYLWCLKCVGPCDHDTVCPDCNPAVRHEG